MVIYSWIVLENILNLGVGTLYLMIGTMSWLGSFDTLLQESAVL
jgi:hypothetical protein